MKSEIVFVLTVFSGILESELGSCMCCIFCVNEREVCKVRFISCISIIFHVLQRTELLCLVYIKG